MSLAKHTVDIPFIGDYIQNIRTGRQQGRRAREDQVDHLWNNIFVYYFQREYPDKLAVEREAYISDTEDRKTNMAVVNRRGNPPRMEKVILFEAKRPLTHGTDVEPAEKDWTEVKDQLQRNMLTARQSYSSDPVQRMYGVTAIGLYARMYVLTPNANALRKLKNGDKFQYHVVRDDVEIEEVLEDLCRAILAT